MSRVHNFNAGPAALPLEVLEEIQRELLDFRHTGESILEISHRSAAFTDVIHEAEADIGELLGLPEGYAVLFTSGGANQQFAEVPLNFLTEGKTAAYALTSYFSEKALKEAKKLGDTFVSYLPDTGVYTRVPQPSEFRLPKNTAYLHITSNNTAEGTEYFTFPDTGEVPLIADMTSDLLARPIDVKKFSLIYAGAQKNIGPAGTVVLIAKKDFLRGRDPKLPDTLNYEILLENGSLYNTPSVFTIYAAGKVAHWLKKNGGLAAAEARNREKSDLVYAAIDAHPDFYRAIADRDSRSIVNVTFRLPSEALTADFVKDAEARGLYGLKGHRAAGGIRASLYNGVPLASAKALADFIEEFYEAHRQG